MISHGCDIEARDTDFFIALHITARYGRCAIVEFLLENSANVNCANRNNQTALHLAAVHGFHEIVFLVLKHRAIIAAKDDSGWNRCIVLIHFIMLVFAAKGLNHECLPSVLSNS